MKLVGVRFKEAGKIEYFDGGDFDFYYEEKVVVESENGIDLAEVAQPVVNPDFETSPVGVILRKASPDDIKDAYLNGLDAAEAIEISQDMANKLNLKMKVVDASFSLDKAKLTIYFTADNRIDFRELVKNLAATFKSRIELRQIGVRDHAKLIKHHGSCGQQCCCSRHLTDFAPLSIKYAKDQNISLDPTKISGVCGRLMCCLSYEQDNYKQAKKIMPKYGQKVKTADGVGVILNNNLLTEECKVKVLLEDDEQVEKIYKLCELEVI